MITPPPPPKFCLLSVCVYAHSPRNLCSTTTATATVYTRTREIELELQRFVQTHKRTHNPPHLQACITWQPKRQLPERERAEEKRHGGGASSVAILYANIDMSSCCCCCCCCIPPPRGGGGYRATSPFLCIYNTSVAQTITSGY